MYKYGIIEDFSPSHKNTIFSKAIFTFIVYHTVLAYLYADDYAFAHFIAPYVLASIPIFFIIYCIVAYKYPEDKYYLIRPIEKCPFCCGEVLSLNKEALLHHQHCIDCGASVKIKLEYYNNPSNEAMKSFLFFIMFITMSVYIFFDNCYTFVRDISIACFFLCFFIETQFTMHKNKWKKAKKNK